MGGSGYLNNSNKCRTTLGGIESAACIVNINIIYLFIIPLRRGRCSTTKHYQYLDEVSNDLVTISPGYRILEALFYILL